jgi:hypothetical protein
MTRIPHDKLSYPRHPHQIFHPLDDQMSQFIQSPRPPLAGLYSIFNGGPLKGESYDALIESDSTAEMGGFFNRR